MRRRIGGFGGSGGANGSRPVNCVSSRNSRTLSFSFRASQPRRKMALMFSSGERRVGVEAERGGDLARTHRR